MSALHAGRQWSEAELDAKFGADAPPGEVLVLHTGGSSTVSDNPRPLSLVPCVTGDEEAEGERLLRDHANGKITPPPVHLPELSPHATDAMRKVAEFFATYCGLRLWAGEDRAVPLSVRFVERHTGLHFRTAHRALRRLCDEGILKPGEPLPPRGARGTHTYLPGGAE